MSATRGDSLVFSAAALGLCCVLAWDAVDERDRRIAAEERLRQVEWAAERTCRTRPGHKLVTTVNADSDGHLVRWCGYYRTAIESVRVVWERAQ